MKQKRNGDGIRETHVFDALVYLQTIKKSCYYKKVSSCQ